MNIDKKELQTENVVSFLSAYESKIGKSQDKKFASLFISIGIYDSCIKLCLNTTYLGPNPPVRVLLVVTSKVL